jgi:hypothetical protein
MGRFSIKTFITKVLKFRTFKINSELEKRRDNIYRILHEAILSANWSILPVPKDDEYKYVWVTGK